MARSPEAKEPTPTSPDQPGPTDVTMEEVLEEMTVSVGQLDQQLAVARIKIRKQTELITQLQRELAKKAPSNAEDA